jgi:hypothetical protein
MDLSNYLKQKVDSLGSGLSTNQYTDDSSVHGPPVQNPTTQEVWKEDAHCPQRKVGNYSYYGKMLLGFVMRILYQIVLWLHYQYSCSLSLPPWCSETEMR